MFDLSIEFGGIRATGITKGYPCTALAFVPHRKCDAGDAYNLTLV